MEYKRKKEKRGAGRISFIKMLLSWRWEDSSFAKDEGQHHLGKFMDLATVTACRRPAHIETAR